LIIYVLPYLSHEERKISWNNRLLASSHWPLAIGNVVCDFEKLNGKKLSGMGDCWPLAIGHVVCDFEILNGKKLSGMGDC
jgi:hypothetical protein